MLGAGGLRRPGVVGKAPSRRGRECRRNRRRRPARFALCLRRATRRAGGNRLERRMRCLVALLASQRAASGCGGAAGVRRNPVRLHRRPPVHRRRRVPRHARPRLDTGDAAAVAVLAGPRRLRPSLHAVATSATRPWRTGRFSVPAPVGMTGACGNAVHTAKPHASPVRQGCSEQGTDAHPAPRQPSPPALSRHREREHAAPLHTDQPPEGPHPLTREGRPHPSERCFGFAQHDNLRAPSQPLVRCPRTLDSRLRGNDGHGRQMPIQRVPGPLPHGRGPTTPQ